MFRVHQRALAILVRQNLVICIRDFGQHAFEHRFAHRIQLVHMIRVVIFASPNSRMCVWPRLTEACDVNVQPVTHIHPACINDIHAVAADALVDPWVDVEQVFAPHGTFGGSVLVPGVIEIPA